MNPKKHSHRTIRDFFVKSQSLILSVGLLVLLIVQFGITAVTIEKYNKKAAQVMLETLKDQTKAAIEFKDVGYLEKTVNQYIAVYPIKRVRLVGDGVIDGLEYVSRRPSEGWFDDVLEQYFYTEPYQVEVHGINQERVAKLLVYFDVRDISDSWSSWLFVNLLGFIVIGFLWWYSINRAYRKIIGTLEPLSSVVSLVGQQKIYDVRFTQKSELKEIQVLIETFNRLLDEVQYWHKHLQKENEQLSYKAHHDELTLLPNRYVFYHRLEKVYNDVEMRKQTGLVFLDANEFKQINDVYGHQAGDAVLMEIAQRVKSSIRSHDLFARIGGDEFAILLYSVKKDADLQGIAQKIMACCQQPLWFNGQEIYFSFSLGLAFASSALTSEELIKQADSAMYKAKQNPQHWEVFTFGDKA